MATIRKRGNRYQVQIRRSGYSSLSRSFITLKDAKAWACYMEVQVDRRELPPDSRVLKEWTLGQLVARYRDTVSIRKRTATTEQIVLNAFLRRSICSLRLSALRTSHFADYRDQRLCEIKAASLRRELAPIRHLFEEWGLPIRENPLSQLSISDADQRRERRLHPGEFERIVAAAQRSRNRLVLPIILIAVLTGMRRSEILGIHWSHVDRQTQTLLIPKSKNGHSRTIPLLDGLQTILDRVSHTGSRVFPLNSNAFRLAWERVLLRAGIQDLHFHDLRHEAISRFFEAGLSVPEVALISGHRDPRMLFRYTHPLRQAINKKLKGKDLIESPITAEVALA